MILFINYTEKSARKLVNGFSNICSHKARISEKHNLSNYQKFALQVYYTVSVSMLECITLVLLLIWLINFISQAKKINKMFVNRRKNSQMHFTKTEIIRSKISRVLLETSQQG